MLLIYVPKLTNRLGYTINVVMRDLLHIDFAITTAADVFEAFDGPRLCYGSNRLGGETVPYLMSAHLLFETSVEEHDCHYFTYEGLPALYPVFGNDLALPFDPFSAIFFMLSRYEEYLPHRSDEHGRYLVTESLAYKHDFIQVPVVDHWALMVKDVVLRYYPEVSFRKRRFSFQQTVDIDAAYCYLHKGLPRTCIGMMRDIFAYGDFGAVRKRMRVLMGRDHDPYDTFDYLIEQSCKYKFVHKLIFFVLLGDYGIYDKPASYHSDDFRQLIQHIGDYSKVGVHGSYFSASEPDRFAEEVKRLSGILRRAIVRNRFHYLRFNLPHAYRMLDRLGVRHDYSMGYAHTAGFRNGSCSTTPFFDITHNQELDVQVHPFVAMDTTFHTHMGLSPQEAMSQYHKLIDGIREVEGTFTCIFHNQNLSDEQDWMGWREVYEDVLAYAAAAAGRQDINTSAND